MLEFAHDRRIRKVVMTSSEAVVGLANTCSFVRPLLLPVGETHPSLAQDAYGLRKGPEQVAARFARQCSAMSVINIRFAWILHPDDYPGCAPESASRSVQSGRYVDVRDAS